jgi:hypothetical protein
LPAVPEWNEMERGAIVVPRFLVILKITTMTSAAAALLRLRFLSVLKS